MSQYHVQYMYKQTTCVMWKIDELLIGLMLKNGCHKLAES